MTARTWPLNDATPAGTALGPSNTKALDGTSAGSYNPGGVVTSSNTHPFQSGLAAKFVTPGDGFLSLPAVAAHTQGAIRFYHYMEALPPGNVSAFIKLPQGAGTPTLKLGLQTTGKLWGRDATDGSLGTSAVAVAVGKWNRFELVYAVGTSGSMTINVYDGDATSPYVSFPQSKNFGASGVGQVDIGYPSGGPGGVAWQQWFAGLTINDGATAEIGPLTAVSVLATPVVSVTHTNPTTNGGTDGSITATVTSAVPGAVGYRFGKLPGNVATGVDPGETEQPGLSKTWTGQPAGVQTVTVQAV